MLRIANLLSSACCVYFFGGGKSRSFVCLPSEKPQYRHRPNTRTGPVCRSKTELSTSSTKSRSGLLFLLAVDIESDRSGPIHLSGAAHGGGIYGMV